METLDWTEETPRSVPSLGQARDDDHDEAENGGQFECEPEPLPGEYSAGEMAEDEWWELEPDCPSLEEGESNASRPEATQHPLSNAARPPRPAGTGRQNLRRPRTVADQNWEEARQSAWLRQMLSDTSSDEEEDEERYGRFAESGRWMS